MSAPQPDAWWADIAARAASVHECLNPANTGPLALNVAQIRRWEATAGQSDPASFAQRLAALGLDLDQLARVRLPGPEQGLPVWVRPLQEACHVDAIEPPPPSSAAEHLPVLLAPLLTVAANRLAAETAVVRGVRDDLVRSLQFELVELVSPVVAPMWHEVREQRAQSWQQWQRDVAAQGCRCLWSEYPALARLVGTAICFWVTASAELAQRAAADVEMISQHFGVRVDELVSVSDGLSDAHEQHRKVRRCTFRSASGSELEVMYKPHDVAAEAAFTSLMSWLAQRGAPVGRVVNVLVRPGYGWCEYVAARPARDAAEVRQYFTRAGGLAAILHGLGGTDATTENVVAAGDSPVLIDAETVLTPTSLIQGARPPTASIVDTLILPRWMPLGGRVLDVSALRQPDNQPIGLPSLQWQEADSDRAHLRLVEGDELRRNGELFDANRVPRSAGDYAADVLRGVTQMLANIRANQASLIEGDGPLAELAQVTVRAILRPTPMYLRMLRSSLSPQNLRSGIDRSIHFDRAARMVLRQRDALGWQFAERELAQLFDHDVPMFRVPANADRLDDDAGQLIASFRESASTRAFERIASLDESALGWQVRLARSSLRCADVSRWTGQPSAEADDLIGAIAGQCQPVVDGLIAVGVVELDPGHWTVAALDNSYLDGVAGLTLALAVASLAPDLPGHDRAEQLATEILRPASTQRLPAAGTREHAAFALTAELLRLARRSGGGASSDKLQTCAASPPVLACLALRDGLAGELLARALPQLPDATARLITYRLPDLVE